MRLDLCVLLVWGGVSVLTFAVSMNGSGPHLTWRQTHHAYYGWALIALGWALRSPAAMIAGNVLAHEDSTQHFTQCFGYSPVHWVWRRASRFPLAQRLTRWADTRFKRRGT